ncbi:MAG: hypothetical protein RBS77_05780 [Candidatus Moranbacteria bacterium]|jgi:hypothetical protein|nr:hypothetical protein [Candidatus Moranbacteria bacterium]
MRKNFDKLLIGLTGEYLVAGMMSLKGWVASLTLKNYPSVDIFGLNPETNQNINIQVKTLKNATNFPVGVVRSKRVDIDQIINCSFVFVYIGKNDSIRYFIISRQDLIDLIIKTDDEYFNKPREKELKDYPIGISLKQIAEYENKWENLWKE